MKWINDNVGVIRYKFNSAPIWITYLAFMLITLLIFIFIAAYTGGVSITNVLFPYQHESFMDYYVSVRD